MFKSLFVFSILFSVVALTTMAQTNPNQTTATKELYALFDAEWNSRLQESPTFASYLGDRRFNDRWNDASLTAIENRQKHRIETLEKLKKIDRNGLSAADKLNFDLFEKEYAEDIEAHKYKRYLLPVSHDGGIQTADNLARFLRFQTVKDYEDWLAWLNSFPALMEQTL